MSAAGKFRAARNNSTTRVAKFGIVGCVTDKDPDSGNRHGDSDSNAGLCVNSEPELSSTLPSSAHRWTRRRTSEPRAQPGPGVPLKRLIARRHGTEEWQVRLTFA